MGVCAVVGCHESGRTTRSCAYVSSGVVEDAEPSATLSLSPVLIWTSPSITSLSFPPFPLSSRRHRRPARDSNTLQLPVTGDEKYPASLTSSLFKAPTHPHEFAKSCKPSAPFPTLSIFCPTHSQYASSSTHSTTSHGGSPIRHRVLCNGGHSHR